MRRKAELLTNAETTAEGARDEAVRSLAQGLVAGAWMKAHHIASGGERGRSAPRHSKKQPEMLCAYADPFQLHFLSVESKREGGFY